MRQNEITKQKSEKVFKRNNEKTPKVSRKSTKMAREDDHSLYASVVTLTIPLQMFSTLQPPYRLITDDNLLTYCTFSLQL